MDILNNIFYFLITVGILVFVHEFGHFIAAKLSGMRVDRFSIGFPPRALGKRIGDTDYCISWIPIGGYVKIAGMIDESFDTEFLDREPQPWEFRAKPLYQRMFVISAGVLMNVLLAIVIFWGLNFAQGKFLRQTTEVGYVIEGSPAFNAGLKAGDKILAINGKKVSYWEDIQSLVYLENLGHDITFDIDRGQQLRIEIPRSAIPEISEEHFGLVPNYTVTVVGSVEPNRPAVALGLKPEDVILSLNGIPITHQLQVISIISKSAGKEVRVEWRRGIEIFKGIAVPDKDGRIGIQIGSSYIGPFQHLQYNLLQALPEGIKDAQEASVLFLKSILQIIMGKVSLTKSVGGPIAIAKIATKSAESGPGTFFGFMALLSMSLAILNILPFPALDGGHLLFLVYEAIFRREIPNRVKLALQQAGFILLLAFMAFVIYNDITKF